MTDEVRSKEEILDSMDSISKDNDWFRISNETRQVIIQRRGVSLVIEVLLDIRDELTAIRHEMPNTGEHLCKL